MMCWLRSRLAWVNLNPLPAPPAPRSQSTIMAYGWRQDGSSLQLARTRPPASWSHNMGTVPLSLLLVSILLLVVITTAQDVNMTTVWPDDAAQTRHGETASHDHSQPPEYQDNSSETSLPSTKSASIRRLTSQQSQKSDITSGAQTKQQNGAVEPTLDSSSDDGITQGYDVMQSLTFRVTLGVCMSLVCILIVILVLMMIYTKYRGWKDRMNVGPTVRVGEHASPDRQELMT